MKIINKKTIAILAFSLGGVISSSSFASPMLQSLSGESSGSQNADSSISESGTTQAKSKDNGHVNRFKNRKLNTKKNKNTLTLYNVSKNKMETVDITTLSNERAQEFLPPIESSHKLYDYLINEKHDKPYIALMMTYTVLNDSLKSGKQTLGADELKSGLSKQIEKEKDIDLSDAKINPEEKVSQQEKTTLTK